MDKQRHQAEAGEAVTYDADAILQRMRNDREHDWPHRLLNTMGRETRISKGETRALHAASHGLTEQMTADTYNVSPETIHSQLRTARLKLRAKTTTHAVAIAIRTGLF